MTAASRLWIKVCGMTDPEGIAAAVSAGVDAVGFVFYAPSPRNLSISRAAELQSLVPAGIQRVAVFLHPEPALVADVLATVRPHCVQLDLDDFAALEIPANVVRLPVVRSGTIPSQLPARVLLESARSGHGERADWAQASELGERHEIVLAGGLDADNVALAIATARPFGVDVSSGVESRRGVKDPALIERFVNSARRAASAAVARA
jgi:phosphoribosylanthranilate isomerase